MLSVCIPVYNTNVLSLIDALIIEKETCDLSVEIILIDDGSSAIWKKANKAAGAKVKYIELKKNIGRASVRNLFLNYTQSEYLLFIDNDSLIVSQRFLTKYLEAVKHNFYGVICGGKVYDVKAPSKEKMLRWKYGTKIESRSMTKRMQDPYKSFMTTNFLINRNILKKLPFDERLTSYGHEDTLFGFYLKKNNIPIKHIENPVMTGNLETNQEYLEKTEQGVMNLIKILEFVNDDPDFIENITLLKVFKKISACKLIGAVHFIFNLLKPITRLLLLRGKVSITMFNFYKLGIFIENYSGKEKVKLMEK